MIELVALEAIEGRKSGRESGKRRRCLGVGLTKVLQLVLIVELFGLVDWGLLTPFCLLHLFMDPISR